MKRRKFLVGLLAGLIGPRARAQQRVRISILHSGFPNRTPVHQLFEALSKLGLEHGRTATIDLLGGEGDPKKLNALVEQIGVQKPDVIIAITSPAVVALKEAKLTIPVVFAFVPDPVGLGIVESLSQPGGNFTGVTYSESGLGESGLSCFLKQLPGRQKSLYFGTLRFRGMLTPWKISGHRLWRAAQRSFRVNLKAWRTWSRRSTMPFARKHKPRSSWPTT
jgi:putative ABC transport system substrate-binding protein